MNDPNELLRRLAAQTGDTDAINKIRAALTSADGRRAAELISSQNADLLERAAQAAQQGNMGETARLAKLMMQTGEGASLAQKLQKLFGK